MHINHVKNIKGLLTKILPRFYREISNTYYRQYYNNLMHLVQHLSECFFFLFAKYELNLFVMNYQ